MTSSSWADAVLVVVLLAPLASVILALAVAAPTDDARWTTAGCGIAGVGALVLLVAGERPEVARLAPDDVALAAVCAVALLAVGLPRPWRSPALAAAVTIAIAGIVAGQPGDPSTVGPVLALAAAAVVLAAAPGSSWQDSAVVAASAAIAAGGVRWGDERGTVLVAIGAGLAGAVAARSPRQPLVVLLPVGLLVALRVVPGLGAGTTGRATAVALAAAAAAVVVLPRVLRRLAAWSSAPAALALWTVAAAIGAVESSGVAARPLAVAAVLALALGGPLSLVSAVPGLALLAYALADGAGWARAALVAALVATIGAALSDWHPDHGKATLRPVDAIAAALAAWFLLRPTSWAWVGARGLGDYDEGIAIAAAVALAVAVAATARGARVAVAPLTALLVGAPPRDVGGDEAPRAPRVAIAATALLGLVAAALVRSARL